MAMVIYIHSNGYGNLQTTVLKPPDVYMKA